MDWSFRLLMVFATVGGVLAIDHHLLGEAVTGTIREIVGSLG